MPPTLIALPHDDYHATGMGRIKNSLQVLVLEDYLRMSDLPPRRKTIVSQTAPNLKWLGTERRVCSAPG